MMVQHLRSLPLLLNKIFPVFHGHIGFLEMGIFAIGYGNGFKESLP